MENPFKDEIQKIIDMVGIDRSITTTSSETAERLVLAFAKARISFTYIPQSHFDGYNGEIAAIKVHANSESFMPIFNFATSMKIEEPVEQEMVKELLRKYNINLIISPKENKNSWDII